MIDLTQAHRHAANHRREIAESLVCGCFHCLRVFAPREIRAWVDTECARCPHCGVDAVLGDASGLPMTRAFLAEMRARWFEVG